MSDEYKFDEEAYIKLQDEKADAQVDINTLTSEYDRATESLRETVEAKAVAIKIMEDMVFETINDDDDQEYEHVRFIVKTGPRTVKGEKGFATEYENFISHLPDEQKTIARLLYVKKETTTYKAEGVAMIQKICAKVPFLEDHQKDIEKILGVKEGRRLEKVEHTL